MPHVVNATRLVATLLVLLGAGCAKDEGAVPAMVRRCVDAHGGRAALEAVRAVKQAGQVQALAHPGVTGSMIRGYEAPDRLRVELVYPESEPEIRILDGKAGWRQGAKATKPQYDAMVLQAARHALPLGLLANADKLVDKGLSTREGRQVHTFEQPVGDLGRLSVEIDVATALITKTVGRVDPFEFATEYADYRTVEGVRFAFVERSWAQGQSTGETRFFEITPQKDGFPAGVFAPAR